jgi:hypothetical protein
MNLKVRKKKDVLPSVRFYLAFFIGRDKVGYEKSEYLSGKFHLTSHLST